ncbi:hypothetical protein SAMN03080615_00506 [Amphritea atlantica]|uniref:Uncharacterized protein n=2 Tax=Amphritea atlantica TaxID=355243 RepID=A0A1H9DEP0_9GAMM|nr:hypothetical protein SAMN03080615_00506 [Amphritea atlantica]
MISNGGKMRNVLILLILAGIGIAGYLYLNPAQLAQTPPPEVRQDELSKMAVQRETEKAQRHIDNLTAAPEQAIEIGTANNFVTQDQLLKLPTDLATAIAATEAVKEGDAKTYGINLEQIGNSLHPQHKAVPTSQLPLADQVRLKELLNNPDNPAGTLFYIHGVSDADKQGLWGIIQSGLIDTFAKGIQLKAQLISADIPQEADERLPNSTSSFLGSILDQKVKDTYVYNYHKGILGQNPNLITPGQELIVVTFSQDELIDIYNHFAQQ